MVPILLWGILIVGTLKNCLESRLRAISSSLASVEFRAATALLLLQQQNSRICNSCLLLERSQLIRRHQCLHLNRPADSGLRPANLSRLAASAWICALLLNDAF